MPSIASAGGKITLTAPKINTGEKLEVGLDDKKTGRTIGSPLVVINAAVDAVAQFGIKVVDMPAFRQRMWMLLNSANARRDEACHAVGCWLIEEVRMEDQGHAVSAVPLHIDSVLGSHRDLAELIHDAQHAGVLDVLRLPAADIGRRRMRARSEAGREITIALPRAHRLFDGAVLVAKRTLVLVVRVAAEQWLRLEPRSAADAIQLGYHAGNLHWRVRFADDALLVLLDAPVEVYLARIEPLLSKERVSFSIVGPKGEV